MVQTLKQYVLSLGPPSNEILRYVVTALVICWAWNMLLGRKPWSATGKVRSLCPPCLASLGDSSCVSSLARRQPISCSIAS